MKLTNNSLNQQNQQQSSQQNNEQDQIQLIMMKMKESKVFWKLQNELLNKIKQESKHYSIDQDKIQQISRQQTIEQELKKLILNCASKSIKIDPIRVDPIEYINQSRYKWSEILIKKYDYIQEKIKVYRISGNNLPDSGHELDTLYIYDIKNYLSFLYSIKTPTNIQTNNRKNSFLKHNIPVPSYNQIKEKYKGLLMSDNSDLVNEDQAALKERNKQAKSLVENEPMEQEIEQFAQGGIPTSFRVELYMKYFGIESSNGINHKFQQMIDEYDKTNSIFDTIIISDGHEAAFDNIYFVFQSNFEKLLKVFIRDKDVQKSSKIHPQNYDKLSHTDQSKVPQCGFFFPKMFTKFIQPFGYMSMKMDIQYQLFKHFYMRYYCNLLSISTMKDSILYLMVLFEDLLQSTDSRLLNHISQIDNFDPFLTAFNWIHNCFIGCLDVGQIFLIFDRIIGYKSLEILAISAAAVFRYRSDRLLSCSTAKEAEHVLQQPIQEDFLYLIRNYFVY